MFSAKKKASRLVCLCKGSKKILFEQIIHVAVALLEAQEIGQGRCVCGDAEAIGLVGAHGHPGYGNIEAVEVVGGTELRGGEAHGHDIEAGSGLNAQARGELDIAAKVDSLGKLVIDSKFLGGLLVSVTLGIVKGVTHVDGPGRIGIHVVHVAAGDVFTGNRMIINPLIGIGIATSSASAATTAFGILSTVVPINGTFSVIGEGGR